MCRLPSGTQMSLPAAMRGASIRWAHSSASHCGLALSFRPLVEEGIDSLSLNPDAVLRTRLAIAELEAPLAG